MRASLLGEITHDARGYHIAAAVIVVTLIVCITALIAWFIWLDGKHYDRNRQ